MTSVSRKEGFRYGLYLFSYWLVVLVFSAALAVAGGWIVYQQTETGNIGANQEGVLAVLGGFVTFLGVLVFGAGHTGLTYKLVADGVGAGAVEAVAGNGRPSGSGHGEEGAEDGTDRTDEGWMALTGPVDNEPEPTPRRSEASGPSESPGSGDGDTGADAATTETVDPQPRETGWESPQRGSASPGPATGDADAPVDGDQGPDGDPTGTTDGEAGALGDEAGEGSTSELGRSFEDVASESEIAEELGFGGDEPDERLGAGDPGAGGGSDPTVETGGSAGGPADGADGDPFEDVAEAGDDSDPFAGTETEAGEGGDADPLAGSDDTDPLTGSDDADPLAGSESGDPLAESDGSDPLAGPSDEPRTGSETDGAADGERSDDEIEGEDGDELDDAGWTTGDDRTDDEE